MCKDLTIIGLVLGVGQGETEDDAPATTFGVKIVSVTPHPTPGLPTNPDPRDRVPNPEEPIVPKPIRGLPAIDPTRPDAPTGEPTFDASTAAEQALKEQPWQCNFPVNGTVTVASVELQTGEQLNESPVSGGVQFGLDRLFFVVTITGDFTQTAQLPDHAGPLGQPKNASAAYVLYDARTGNYLGMGGSASAN